jgi:tetratricopeptide (TPR) repeat protein
MACPDDDGIGQIADPAAFARKLLQDYTSLGAGGVHETMTRTSRRGFSPGDARSEGAGALEDSAVLLKNVGDELMQIYDAKADHAALSTAICVFEEVLELRPGGHDLHEVSLLDLGNAFRQYQIELAQLDEAVHLHAYIVHLCWRGNPEHQQALATLGIDMGRKLLTVCPPEDHSRPYLFQRLAIAFQVRFAQDGDLSTLAQAIEQYRKAVDACPPDHDGRANILYGLGAALGDDFDHHGGLDSLEDAVSKIREALDLQDPEDDDRPAFLGGLATMLRRMFDETGDLEAVSECIREHRAAVLLCPPTHPRRGTCVHNLANALQTRFHQEGDVAALNESIDLHREALDLHPPGHRHRALCINSLAIALRSLFDQQHELAALAEAIDLHRDALSLLPPGNAYRAVSLNNLGTSLLTQFEKAGRHDLNLLAEAVTLLRQSLELRPVSHPDHVAALENLGEALRAQYLSRSLVPALEEELHLASERLQHCGDGHPRRVHFLFTVGECHLRSGTPIFDFDVGLWHITEGLRDGTSSARDRLGRTISALWLVEDACASIFKSTDALGLNRSRQDDAVLHVYILAMRLLPRVASLGLDYDGRLRELSSAEAISRNAATRAIRMDRNAEAVEMLEEGRGMFWSQALRLRSTDLDLLHLPDAQKLRGLFKKLDGRSVHDSSVAVAESERQVEQRRRDSEAAEKLIAEIRSRPGFERFLRPAEFSTLVQSLELPHNGFVVILVASELGHHALLLDGAAARAKSIDLVAPEGGFFSEVVRASVLRDAVPDSKDTNVSRNFGVSKKGDRKRRELVETLAQLWTSVVKPVIDSFGITVCPNFGHRT